MAKLHRFFVGDSFQLKKDFWLHEASLLWQWNRVLRFREGTEVVLFDGTSTDRLYVIVKLTQNEAHMQMITELDRTLPSRHVYLFWSLLKKDNNELILQKATELGVSNFVPLLTDRTIKKDFSIDRARKIVTEASEQCGRSDIPHVREPVHILKALEEYKEKLQIFVCHQGSNQELDLPDRLGLIVGPEGGWSDDELQYFSENNYQHVSLGEFTLRAETAAIIASSRAF